MNMKTRIFTNEAFKVLSYNIESQALIFTAGVGRQIYIQWSHGNIVKFINDTISC
jgi:hypothetical protein